MKNAVFPSSSSPDNHNDGSYHAIGFEKINNILGFTDLQEIAAFNRYRMDECSLLTIAMNSFIVFGFGGIVVEFDTESAIYVRLGKLLAAICLFCFNLQVATHQGYLNSKAIQFLPPPVVMCNLTAFFGISSSIYAFYSRSGEHHLGDGDAAMALELTTLLIKIVFMSFLLRLLSRLMHAICATAGVVTCLVTVASGALHGFVARGVIVFCYICVAMVWEIDRSVMYSFISKHNLKRAATIAAESEVRRNIAESFSLELRAFIGNIAHDLKTPVQAMVTELDLLSDQMLGSTPTTPRVLYNSNLRSPTAQQAESSIRKSFQTASACKSNRMINNNPELIIPQLKISSSSSERDKSSTRTTKLSSVYSLKILCTFMTTMINRSLDFVKSESGVPLVPSADTIDIRPSIDFVINCVLNVSNPAVPIRLNSISNDITRFVITDKQWFEENLLCLTSNAAKFTSSGSVDLRVCVVTADVGGGGPSQSTDTSKTNDKRAHVRPAEYPVPVAEVDIEAPADAHPLSLLNMATESSAHETNNNFYREHDMLRVEVEDSGIGLTPEQMQGLFQPFKQAQRKAGGTGLGLFALSKRCEAIGGRCGVRKRADGRPGCVFWFEVPYRPDDVTAALLLLDDSESISGKSGYPGVGEPAGDVIPNDCQLRSNTRSAAAAAASSSSVLNHDPIIGSPAVMNCVPVPAARTSNSAETGHIPIRILLVEDTPMIQKATSRALEREGYKVDVCMNGAEALSQLEKMQENGGRYDIMLLDIQMPVMDGMECIERLRAREAAAAAAAASEEAKAEAKKVNSQSENIIKGNELLAHHRQFVVGVSASSDSETRERALSLGMDDFIMKPMKVEQLKERCPVLRKCKEK